MDGVYHSQCSFTLHAPCVGLEKNDPQTHVFERLVPSWGNSLGETEGVALEKVCHWGSLCSFCLMGFDSACRLAFSRLQHRGCLLPRPWHDGEHLKLQASPN